MELSTFDNFGLVFIFWFLIMMFRYLWHSVFGEELSEYKFHQAILFAIICAAFFSVSDVFLSERRNYTLNEEELQQVVDEWMTEIANKKNGNEQIQVAKPPKEYTKKDFITYTIAFFFGFFVYYFDYIVAIFVKDNFKDIEKNKKLIFGILSGIGIAIFCFLLDYLKYIIK